MEPIDHFFLGFTTGLALAYVFYIVYLDVRSKMERFIFLRWKQKARYWIGY